MIVRRGMGAYPDSSCFDPTRPALLPYWFDDFAEAACWDNQFLFGNPTGNTAQAGQPGAAATTIANAAAACAAQSGSWDPSTNICTPNPLGQMGQYLPWIVGGVLIIGFFFGGRR
jgi:hypothetical protein